MTAYLKGILFVSVLLLFRVESEEKDKKSNNNPLFQILSLSNKPANTSEEFNKYESCLKNDDNLDMLHTFIEGPPGVGKTIFGKILARIYLSLGITHKDKFGIYFFIQNFLYKVY